MTVGEFVNLVTKMREAEKRYFANRTKESLADAKYWEARVDAALKEREERRTEEAQPKLGF